MKKMKNQIISQKHKKKVNKKGSSSVGSFEGKSFNFVEISFKEESKSPRKK